MKFYALKKNVSKTCNFTVDFFLILTIITSFWQSKYHQKSPKSKTMEVVFMDYNFIKSWTKTPNLEWILSKSSESKIFETKKGNKSRFCCEYISERLKFEFRKVAKLFFSKFNFECGSSNLIYVDIHCSCQEEYLGQISTLLKDRVSDYKYHKNHSQYQISRARQSKCRQEYT